MNVCYRGLTAFVSVSLASLMRLPPTAKHQLRRRLWRPFVCCAPRCQARFRVFLCGDSWSLRWSPSECGCEIPPKKGLCIWVIEDAPLITFVPAPSCSLWHMRSTGLHTRLSAPSLATAGRWPAASSAFIVAWPWKRGHSRSWKRKLPA